MADAKEGPTQPGKATKSKKHKKPKFLLTKGSLVVRNRTTIRRQLRHAVSAGGNLHTNIEKIVGKASDEIRSEIEKVGWRKFAKLEINRGRKSGKSRKNSDSRANIYSAANFKHAINLCVMGAKEDNVTFPPVVADRLPAKVKIEICQIGFGAWCSENGFAYQKALEAAKAKDFKDVLFKRSKSKPGRKTGVRNRKVASGQKPGKRVMLAGARQLIPVNNAANAVKEKAELEEKLRQREIVYEDYANMLFSEYEKRDAKKFIKFLKSKKREIKVLEDGIEYYTDHRKIRDIDLEFLANILRQIDLFRNKKRDRLKSSLEYFKWPSTEIRSLVLAATPEDYFNRRLTTDDFSGEQLFTDFEYRVGRNGLPTVRRRQILETLLATQQPGLEAKYRNIGGAQTAARLKRIAYAIAGCVRRAKYQTRDYSVAISDWEDDLRYLKRNHYDGKFDISGGNFPWPRI